MIPSNMNWLNWHKVRKLQQGKVIPEIVIYGDKDKAKALDLQGRKYAEDMAKYRQDSIEHAKTNEDYQRKLKLYNDSLVSYKLTKDLVKNFTNAQYKFEKDYNDAINKFGGFDTIPIPKHDSILNALYKPFLKSQYPNLDKINEYIDRTGNLPTEINKVREFNIFHFSPESSMTPEKYVVNKILTDKQFIPTWGDTEINTYRKPIKPKIVERTELTKPDTISIRVIPEEHKGWKYMPNQYIGVVPPQPWMYK